MADLSALIVHVGGGYVAVPAIGAILAARRWELTIVPAVLAATIATGTAALLAHAALDWLRTLTAGPVLDALVGPALALVAATTISSAASGLLAEYAPETTRE